MNRFAYHISKYLFNMLFNRNLEEYIIDWTKRPARRPLIIRGARQVGKTSFVRSMSSFFDIYIELNLELSKDKIFFEYADDVEKLFDSILLDRSIVYNATQTCLLFIDEIQSSPKAITMLRYFYEKLPSIYVIAAGSLLEFSLEDVSSFPVGRVEQIVMYPMNFREFLNAINKKSLAERFDGLDFSESTNAILAREFQNYMITGGLPQSISEYIRENYSFKKIRFVLENLWLNYLDDTLKYGRNDQNKKTLRYILESSPFTLDRFSFESFSNNQFKARDIGIAFRQLEQAKIMYLIYPTTHTAPPLLPEFKKRPRLQFLDTGLLIALNKKSAELLLVQDANDKFRGLIINHIAIQEIMSISESLLTNFVFWVRENNDSNAEVDLLFEWNGKAIPIEVKSGSSGRLRSLHSFMDRAAHSIAIRLLANEFSIETVKTAQGKSFKLINLPIHYSSQIRKVLDKYQKELL